MCGAIHVALAEQNLLSVLKSKRDPEKIISCINHDYVSNNKYI